MNEARELHSHNEDHLNIDEDHLSGHAKIHNSMPDIHHGEEGEGPWLLSYADMVTLLMCFFILFFSTDEGNVKLKDPTKLAEQMRVLEKMLGVENELAPNTNKFEDVKTNYDLQSLSSSIGESFKSIASDQQILFSVGVPKPGIMEITFTNDAVFRAGSSELSPSAKQYFATIIKKIRATVPDAQITVEGHTDSTGQRHANWLLSAQRAISALRYLEQLGYPSKNLSFQGFGDQKPLMPERDAKNNLIERNMSVNRRIVLRVSAKENEVPN